MARRPLRTGTAAGIALLTASVLAAGAGAQNAVSSGAAKSVDLRTAPALQTPPMPPIFFDRPTPRWAAERMRRLPPDKARGG